MYLRLSATPGSEQTLPRETPARRVVHRRPFFRRKIIGLLCWKGVEPPRGRGETEWSSGVAGVFLVYYNIPGTPEYMFSKVHVDIMTVTTQEHNTVRITLRVQRSELVYSTSLH